MGLQKLSPYHKSELLKAINNAREVENSGFTEFELEVLILAVSYCCYFTQHWSSPYSKFKNFKKPERYYSETKKLVALKEKIRYKNVRLSSLINDAYISELVQKIEQYDDR